jgi:hypothetical protein
MLDHSKQLLLGADLTPGLFMYMNFHMGGKYSSMDPTGVMSFN